MTLITENSERHKYNKAKLNSLPILSGKPKNEKDEKWLREIDTYEFYNLEEPGLAVRFPYGDTKNFVNFTFYHGGKYQIPRHVARHVETRSTPIHAYRPNGLGQMVKNKTGDQPRFQMRQVLGDE